MTLDKYLLFPLLLTVGACSKQADPPSAREMYDSMSKMVTGSAYPSHWCTIIIIVTTITFVTIFTTITTLLPQVGGAQRLPGLPLAHLGDHDGQGLGGHEAVLDHQGSRRGYLVRNYVGLSQKNPSLQPRPCAGENVHKEVKRRPQGRDGSRATVRGRRRWRLLY